MRELAAAVDAAADPVTALTLARYFRTDAGSYGEGDHFVGVKLSQIRRLARPYRDRTFVAGDWAELLHSRTHEHRLACLVVMADRATLLARRTEPTRGTRAEHEHIYQTYLANTASVNNWDLVDCSAAPVVGSFLADRTRTPLSRLAASSSVWERRIAIVSTHWLIRRGESAETFRIAEALLDDSHHLIHKSVGWMLREAGARVSQRELRDFLDIHAAVMPRTMLRYAIEHLPPEERRHYRQLKMGSGGRTSR